MRWLPLTLLLLLGVIWGTGYSIARFAMTNGVNPLGYSFWQSVGPAILLTLFSLSIHEKIKLNSEYCGYYFVCGLTGIVIPNTNMYFAASHLPAGLLAVIVNTVPVMAYVLALAMGVEFFNWRRFFAVAIAVAAIMLIMIPKTSLPSAEMVPWILIALITPLGFAFCAVYVTRFRPHDGHSVPMAAGMLIFSSILLIPLVLGSHHFYALHYPLNAADWIILLEILLSSIGYIIFFRLIKIAGPVYYTFVDTIVAITGLFWGSVIFNERLNVWTGTAVCLILVSLMLVNKPNTNMKQNP